MTIFSNPFRFDSTGDFWAPETEDEALLAEVTLLVMTRKRTRQIAGEIAWDQEFGTLVEYLRHDRETVDSTEVTAEMQEAFNRYLGAGRVRVVSVVVSSGAMRIDLQYGREKNLSLTLPVEP